MADRIYRIVLPMLRRDIHKGPFRLIGVGLANLVSADDFELAPDLADPQAVRRLAAEGAADRIRARFGQESIRLGRSLR